MCVNVNVNNKLMQSEITMHLSALLSAKCCPELMAAACYSATFRGCLHVKPKLELKRKKTCLQFCLRQITAQNENACELCFCFSFSFTRRRCVGTYGDCSAASTALADLKLTKLSG